MGDTIRHLPCFHKFHKEVSLLIVMFQSLLLNFCCISDVKLFARCSVLTSGLEERNSAQSASLGLVEVCHISLQLEFCLVAAATRGCNFSYWMLSCREFFLSKIKITYCCDQCFWASFCMHVFLAIFVVMIHQLA